MSASEYNSLFRAMNSNGPTGPAGPLGPTGPTGPTGAISQYNSMPVLVITANDIVYLVNTFSKFIQNYGTLFINVNTTSLTVTINSQLFTRDPLLPPFFFTIKANIVNTSTTVNTLTLLYNNGSTTTTIASLTGREPTASYDTDNMIIAYWNGTKLEFY